MKKKNWAVGFKILTYVDFEVEAINEDEALQQAYAKLKNLPIDDKLNWGYEVDECSELEEDE